MLVEMLRGKRFSLADLADMLCIDTGLLLASV